MKTYFRFVVYGRWPTPPGEPAEIYRPHASFATTIEAVEYLDAAVAENAVGPDPTCQYKVIDLEHLDSGDIMLAPEWQPMIEETRRRLARARERT